MTSIEDLTRRLEQIDGNFDKETQLKHWSFEKTQNNRFGVLDSPDFSVFLSFDPQWPDSSKVPGTSRDDVQTGFPNPLQKAFKQVLKAGQDPNKKICFIDLATLNPASGFFTDGGNESVASALISAIDEIDPQVQPVIRIVCGDWVNDAPDKWEQSETWRKTFETIFWDNDGKSRLKNNKQAKLCVGYYRPILTTAKDGQSVKFHSWWDAQID